MEFVAKSILPTSFGRFDIYAFRDSTGEHIALVKGKIKDGIVVRMHSKCLTGDTFTSLRCDCRDQLEKALLYIKSEGGMLIYLDQEGRGIGLANKIRAYHLQDQGFDTVEANEKLGFKDDQRSYKPALDILHYFKLGRIRLITNNQRKITELSNNGIIVERVPLKVKANKYNKIYVQTKIKKLGHLV